MKYDWKSLFFNLINSKENYTKTNYSVKKKLLVGHFKVFFLFKKILQISESRLWTTKQQHVACLYLKLFFNRQTDRKF